MQRKKRVPNPYFKGIPIDWRLQLPKTDTIPGAREGKLSMSFRTRDDAGQKTEFSFPCVVSKHGCFVRKEGTRDVIDEKGKCVFHEKFSIVGRIDEDPKNKKSILVFNDIIDAVARHCGHAISSLSEWVSSYDGIMVIPPKLFRIPKKITFREVSLEKLREAGQI
jgi:hypothetical protein